MVSKSFKEIPGYLPLCLRKTQKKRRQRKEERASFQNNLFLAVKRSEVEEAWPDSLLHGFFPHLVFYLLEEKSKTS